MVDVIHLVCWAVDIRPKSRISASPRSNYLEDGSTLVLVAGNAWAEMGAVGRGVVRDV